jgi:hypothetical protein
VLVVIEKKVQLIPLMLVEIANMMITTFASAESQRIRTALPRTNSRLKAFVNCYN